MKCRILLIVFVAALACAVYADDFITKDAGIPEPRFTGVWAREDVKGTMNEIIWFIEPGVLFIIETTERVTKAELLNILAYFRGEHKNWPSKLDINNEYHKQNYKVETIGEVYYWYGDFRVTGPIPYRFEGNKLFWGNNQKRPHTKITL